MKRRSFLLGALLLACAKTDDPVDPVWGKEPCAHCRMLVGDKRTAGQAGGNGERFFFDDVGCMAAWSEKNARQGSKLWVREDDGRWVDAKTARYEAGAKTPMDYGFVVANARGDIDWEKLTAGVRAREGGAR